VIEPFIHHVPMAATAFEIVHQDQVLGKLTFFDRLIFKGHLSMLQPPLAMKVFLSRQGVLLKDFAGYVKRVTDDLKAHIQQVAAEAGAPYQYLGETHTKARGRSKEDLARQIAQGTGVSEGLICVFSAVEPCTSFDIFSNRDLHELQVIRRRRKCLHFYLYYLHPELGLCHVRLQSWFPFEVQVWVNGREMLARSLDRAGIGYLRHANAFLKVDDWERVQKIANRLARKAWPRLLDRLVRPLNPVLADIRRAGFGGYYWVADQVEVATDVAFTTRPALAKILPGLFTHATSSFSSEDVLRFLGRKLHPALAAEVSTDTRRRPEGWRVKHRMERNSIKVYDKVSVLRVETTINNPTQFRILRAIDGRHQWRPMRKGVANLPRYFQVGQGANERYLDALGTAQHTRDGKQALHQLCRPRTNRGRHHGRFNPVDRTDVALFRAVLAGEHTINGFRNKDLTLRLHPTPPPSRQETKRRCARVSRQIAKLRGHGLVAKIPKRRLYRITAHGLRVMTAVLAIHDREFPAAYAAAT
jgi:hypothetical protein